MSREDVSTVPQAYRLIHHFCAPSARYGTRAPPYDVVRSGALGRCFAVFKTGGQAIVPVSTSAWRLRRHSRFCLSSCPCHIG